MQMDRVIHFDLSAEELKECTRPATCDKGIGRTSDLTGSILVEDHAVNPAVFDEEAAAAGSRASFPSARRPHFHRRSRVRGEDR
jgi:hypothetical protein